MASVIGRGDTEPSNCAWLLVHKTNSPFEAVHHEGDVLLLEGSVGGGRSHDCSCSRDC